MSLTTNRTNCRAKKCNKQKVDILRSVNPLFQYKIKRFII